MAEIDPRIKQFNEMAKEAEAAVGRANAEAQQLKSSIQEDAAAQKRLRAEVDAGRVGSGTVADEPATTKKTAAATDEAATASKRRAEAAATEENALANLNRTKQTTLSLSEMESRYGSYAGRRGFQNQLLGSYGSRADLAAQQYAWIQRRAADGPGLTARPVGALMGQETEQMFGESKRMADAYTGSISRANQELAMGSDGMRRYGALTTEFLGAAQRGQVTIKEIGFQTAATIGKFGGWLAAGSAVYGVFAAFQALKTGAIDAQSGVQQLDRVVNNLNFGQANQQISDLAGEFNLPIATVTEAAFGMGKAFHDQADTMLATKQALYAVKVGEIDAGTATRYLTSIILGFHLRAKDMPVLFDELLVAQKRYAVDLPTLMAGVGKAGGSFRAAGGDLHTLIALITTLQHVSGQAGNVIGTAVQRSPHFIEMPKNQQTLLQFGIDPTKSITAVYDQALNVAKNMSGEKQREIAEALFGPQYGARVGIFLLQNKALFERVLNQTAPANAKGAAEQQLQITLGKASEQISRIGTDLERLGAGIAQSHGFDLIFALIPALDFILGQAVTLVNQFNKLPDGVKQTLSYFIEIMALVRLMRRFNFGETLGGGQGGRAATQGGIRNFAANQVFGGAGDTLGESRRFRESLITDQNLYQRDYNDLAAKNRKLTLEGNQYVKLRNEAQAQGEAYYRQGVYGDAKAADLAKESAAKAGMYAGHVQALGEEQAKIRMQMGMAADNLQQTNESIGRVRNRLGMLTNKGAQAEMERLRGTGQYMPPNVERPSMAEPVPVGGAAPGLAPWQQNEMRTMAELQKRGLSAYARDLHAVPDNQQMMREAEAATTQANTNLERTSSGVGRIGAAFNGVLNRIGSILFAFTIVEIASQTIQDQIAKIGAQSDQATAPMNQAQLRALAQQKPSGTPGATDVFGDFIPQMANADAALAEAHNQNIANAQLQLREQKKGIFLSSGQVLDRVKQVRKSGLEGAALQKALDRLEQERQNSADVALAAQAVGGPDKAKQRSQAVEQAIQALRAGSVSPGSIDFGKLSAKTIDDMLTVYSGQIETVGKSFDPKMATRAAAFFKHQYETLSSSSNYQDLKTLAGDRQNFYQGLTQAIQDELTNALQFARTPTDRLQAAHAAYSQLRSQLVSGPQADVQQSQQRLAELQKRLGGVQGFQDSLKGAQLPFGGSVGDPAQIEVLKNQVKAQEKTLKADIQRRNESMRQYQLAKQQADQAIYQAVSALRDSRYQYREALTADPVKQAQMEISRVNADLPGAIRVYGRDSQQVWSLLQQRAQAIQQAAQEQANLIQAHGAIAGAGVPSWDTVGKDRANLTSLQNQLAYERSHPGAFSPSAVMNLESQVIAAQNQLATDIHQQALDLANAHFAIQQARAQGKGNTVQAAQVAINQAKYDLAHAQSPLDKLAAQQALITAVYQKRDAVAQARLDTINYEVAIGKITTQQEIDQLQQLLSTYKLSLQMRRQIREQIHQLKFADTSGFNLDVGNIQLPTAYEIQRAILGGTGGVHTQVNQTNSFQINNYSSDPNVVGTAIQGVLGGAANSAARSAGIA